MRSMVPISRVTAEYVWGVVGGHVMVCVTIQAYQPWSMPNITLLKQWDSISIPVLSSLDHHTTDEKLLVPVSIYRVTAEHVWGVVGGYIVVYRVIHPWQTWSMPHITFIK